MQAWMPLLPDGTSFDTRVLVRTDLENSSQRQQSSSAWSFLYGNASYVD